MDRENGVVMRSSNNGLVQRLILGGILSSLLVSCVCASGVNSRADSENYSNNISPKIEQVDYDSDSSESRGLEYSISNYEASD